MRFILIIIFGLTIYSWGQTPAKECSCPNNKLAGTTSKTKPDTIFSLTSGKRVVLCGYVENKGNEKLFSEFVLLVCGQDEVIDFWDALTVCRITTVKDTLKIEEVKNLPTRDDLRFVSTVWRIEKISFEHGQVERSSGLNREIRKYNKREMESVLIQYELLNKKLTYDNMDLVYRLFMAAISGDKTARKYLNDKTRFDTLDGTFAEEYKEIMAMLKDWG